MINAFRYGLLGTSDIAIGTAYLIMIGFGVLLFVGVLALLQRGTGVRS